MKIYTNNSVGTKQLTLILSDGSRTSVWLQRGQSYESSLDAFYIDDGIIVKEKASTRKSTKSTKSTNVEGDK